ncbi:acyltransferase domain-containing protein [Umezawaea endophytica]|uniref:Acyltransferase domain-containing protein n=1 Tax=Umezawaea endophytica TaxID=1654476 RepID=A0A9X3AFX1_9PSEU|nr:acyltransferase domain-containing protein [Umezawaea endophytica]MCS7477705.1 acyltransferase domain-containing protein [Umezawaea endophytica]
MGEHEDWAALLLGQPPAADVADPEPVGAEEARRRLALLDVPEVDRADVLATLPTPSGTPELWAALVRCHQVLHADAVPSRAVVWPNAPASLGAAGRYFYVHLYLLALPGLLARHRALRVPYDVTVATARDVGAKVASYREYYGVGGLDRQTWLVRHFRATLFRLGRLQFDRAALAVEQYHAEAGGTGPKQGTPVLEVHIPGDGPMTPDLCDESFRLARPFFAEHFPDERYDHATCRSWLLDRQLADVLPADSNIVRFQRRFELFGPEPACDSDVLEFVFHLPPGTGDLARLPQDTTLQRAIVTHLRAGRHWRQGCGWVALA